MQPTMLRKKTAVTERMTQIFKNKVAVEPCLGTLGLLAKGFGLSLSELLKGV